MANLFATWHRSSDVDLRSEANPVTLLSRARDALVGIPELEDALRLLDGARDEIEAWSVPPIKPGDGLVESVP